MAISASSLQWGPGNQYAYDPASQTYYQGQIKNPTENDPNNTSMWGYNTLSPGATQWLPSTNGWNGGMQTLSASDFDLSGLSPDKAALFSGNPIIGAFKNTPVAKEVTQAPEESFLSSFMKGPMSVIGPALGISGAMNGWLGNYLNLANGGGIGGVSGLADAAGGVIGSGGGGFGLPGAVASGAADASWGVNPQGGGMNWYDEFLNSIGIDPASVAPFESSPTNASIWDMINGGTGGPLMPPADPSGMDPNMVETRPSGWNPSRPDPTMLQSLQQVIQQTGLPPTSALKLLGQLGAAGLGAYASNKQAGALQGLASKYSEYGAPYRAMLAQSYADPSAYLANDPSIQAAVNQGTNALARSLSVRGNPAQSGTALTDIQNYATQNLYGQLGNERNRLANFGGLSGFNAAAPTLDAQAVGQQGNAYNALGYGLQQVTNPQTSLTDLVKALQIGGLA